MKSWLDEREEYQIWAEVEEPIAVLEDKSAWYWTALYVLGVVFTLGFLLFGISLRRFREDFATTLITRQGYPARWASLSRRVVVHEGRHTTQATWFGWLFFPIAWTSRRLRAWLGVPGFAAVYFLLPVPVGFALGRFFLELDADKRAWARCLSEQSMTPADVTSHAERRWRTLSGGSYFWAVPTPFARYFYRSAAKRSLVNWRGE